MLIIENVNGFKKYFMKQVQHSTVFFAVVQHGVTVSNLLPRKAKKKLSNGVIPLESKISKV